MINYWDFKEDKLRKLRKVRRYKIIMLNKVINKLFNYYNLKKILAILILINIHKIIFMIHRLLCKYLI